MLDLITKPPRVQSVTGSRCTFDTRNEGQVFSKQYFSLGLLDSLRVKWRPWIWGESR